MPTFVPSQQAASPRRNARLLHHPTVRVAVKGLPPLRDHRLGRRARRLLVGTAVLVSVLLLLLIAPLPFLDAPLTSLVTGRVARQMTAQMGCPGARSEPPRITLRGGRLLPQLLRRRLSEIEVVLPDATLGGAHHVTFAATLREVTQPSPDTSHADSMDASITIGYANLPTLPDLAEPTFARSPDGSLKITVVPPASAARNVKATLLAKLDLRGETLKLLPQQLVVFGKTVPAAQVAALTGGVRSEKLPHLPTGLTYRSVKPRADGLHVALGGTVTTPLSALPTDVGGQSVSYQAHDGLLGIATQKDLPVFGSIPLTIFTSPRIDGGTLKLVPKSVKILGADRKPSDPIAALVLSQVKQDDLSRELPVLPSGVRYLSVHVDDTGLKVNVGGVTVKPFSALPSTVDGRSTTYRAQNGLLAVTTTGNPSKHSMPIVLHATPTITGTTLDLAPDKIEMFGVTFPARDVLTQISPEMTTFPLQALPAGLAYRGVEVLPAALRIALNGRNVTLRKGALADSEC
jgi:hypothetical protein